MAKNKRKRIPKTVLTLPDLEQSKSAVLNSLPPISSRRSYDHAIREFIDWYCSEPRLAFNKTVVTRYRINLEQGHYASSTINLRLAAVRRLAYEAADAGLLSPDLASGIRRVKGAKKHGVRIGNWLTAEQSRSLLAAFRSEKLRDNEITRSFLYSLDAGYGVLNGISYRTGSTAERGALSICRSDRQRRPHSNRSDSRLSGQCAASLDIRRGNYSWTDFSCHQ